MYVSNDRPGQEPHPILNMALPLLLWVPLLVGVGYFVVRFVRNFEFYHPTLFGPFTPL